MAQTRSAPKAGPDTGAAEQAKEKASEVAGQAQEKAQQTAEQAKNQLREQVDQRSTQAGEKVSATAADVRSVGEELRAQGKEGPAKLADQAAARTQKLGGYLTESSADRILGDIEDMARRQPWAVVAGGIAVGFAAARFLKASSSERYRSSVSGGRPQPSVRAQLGNGQGHSPVGTGMALGNPEVL